VYIEKYIDVSTGTTVSKGPGDVIVPESDHTYRVLSHYVLTLTAEAVRDIQLEAEDTGMMGIKRGRTPSPQPRSSSKRVRN
jgi:F420-0:gamma-glutamyl ligase-like protein